MKKNSATKSLLAGSLILIFTTVSACSSDGGKHPMNHSESEQAAVKAAGPEFKDAKVKAVYDHYIHVKNALINADVKEAKTGATALKTALTAAGNATGAGLAGKIAGAGSIDDQRESLNALTKEVEKVIKMTKLTSGTVYRQHCPMADGDWLASEATIKNPYYGDDMLSCGRVEEEIK